MNPSLFFVRIFFGILSVFFMTTYMIAKPGEGLIGNIALGVLLGLALIGLLIGFDALFRKFNLRTFNVIVIGLFIGYLMGEGIVLVFNAILDLSSIPDFLNTQVLEIVKLTLFLFGTYLGTIMTLRASDQLYVSVPFVKFAPTSEKKRDLIVDISALADPRLIDLCATGIFDNHLIIPRFLLKELYTQVEIGSETVQSAAHQSLSVVKKLEDLSHLGLRFSDTDFPEVRDIHGKLLRLARFLEGSLLVADSTQIKTGTTDGLQTINLHSLSSALKPLMQMGETLSIKVQRYGKEPRQGIGYLEDGTMVVINGGGEYIGQTIETQVLSVKHTSSGRIIFCNVAGDKEHHSDHHVSKRQGNQKIYYQQEETED